MKGLITVQDYGYRYTGQHSRYDGCSFSVTPLPANPVAAMLYVPMQTDTSTFDEMKALECGTLFAVLNKPFAGKCCR